MGVVKLSTAEITQYQKYSNFLAGNTAYDPFAYQLIETITVGSGGAASVTFSNLNTYSTTYQHLQIRVAARDNRGISGTNNTILQFNGDTGSNYRERHVLRGYGSGVDSFDNGQASRIIPFAQPSANDTTSAFGAAVIDILDPYEAKNTTTRTLWGLHVGAGTYIQLQSGLWMNTNAISSIYLAPISGSYVQGSRFSIYGLKAS